MNLHADAAQRFAVYRRLEARNRIVAILRVGVPVLGAVALSALLLQIYASSQTSRFGISNVVVSPDSVTVETPEYSGLLDDGSAYRVSASSARADVEATDRIGLIDAALTMVKPDGVTILVETPAAVLDTSGQIVEIEGEARVSNSEGTSGVLLDTVFDYAAQRLVGNGPVSVDYADGTQIEAEGLTYDAVALVWTFTRATVTLPDTPGANQPAMSTP
jgi:lipopolysaccharide export system protein LptC